MLRLASWSPASIISLLFAGSASQGQHVQTEVITAAAAPVETGGA